MEFEIVEHGSGTCWSTLLESSKVSSKVMDADSGPPKFFAEGSRPRFSVLVSASPARSTGLVITGDACGSPLAAWRYCRSANREVFDIRC